jgi:hypothetical protein
MQRVRKTNVYTFEQRINVGSTALRLHFQGLQPMIRSLRPHSRGRGHARLLVAAALSILAALPGSTMRAGTPSNYSIDFHTITAGGSRLANHCYRLSGSLGQAAPGYSSGGAYALFAGFWQTPSQATSDEIFFSEFEGC